MKKSIITFIICLLLFWVIITPIFAEDCTNRTKNIISHALYYTRSMINNTVELISLERKQVFKDIYQYTMELNVGEGEYDKIRVHRLVKEKAPYRPIRTKKAVMMIPGDTSAFELYLSDSPNNPPENCMAVYLAEQDIDVWGIDFRWTFIPAEATDLSFMKNWDTSFHLNDINIAVKLSRIIRGFTGSGFGKIFLAGLSRGAQFVYAYANKEAKLSKWRRNLKGIIPMDLAYKLAPEEVELKQYAEARYLALKEKYDSGIYYIDDGLGYQYMGMLAITAPEELSPLIPGFTNIQAALFTMTTTYMTFLPPEGPYTPYYHILAGVYDEYGMPIGLQFSSLDYALDFALTRPPYQSIGEYLDGEAMYIDTIDSPHDDYLHKITIPVLYIGAAGGEGEYGIYTTTLLGSKDNSNIIVSLYPPEYAAVDYGHSDLLMADNAESLVWEPIADWINNH